MSHSRLVRTNQELSDFLVAKRKSISPSSAGLPITKRRRTPGLRREEVATLAGVGLSWYTWLEQGRNIRTSKFFLEQVAHALQMDAAEKRHLFLLAYGTGSTEISDVESTVPEIALELLGEVKEMPAFIYNLRWDVLASNEAANMVFGFPEEDSLTPNLLRMLFQDTILSSRISDWAIHANLYVASFRRDFAKASKDPRMVSLVDDLSRKSLEFSTIWKQQSVAGFCQGRRIIDVSTAGAIEFNHKTIDIDSDQNLRMALYAACPQSSNKERFLVILNQYCNESKVAPAI